MTKKINVNATNSKIVDGKLFITELKMNNLSEALEEFIVRGNSVHFPVLGKLYQYEGPYSREKYIMN